MASEGEYLAALLDTIRSRRWGNDCPGMNEDLRIEDLTLETATDGVEDLVVQVALWDNGWSRVGAIRMPFDSQVRGPSGSDDPHDAAVRVVRAVDLGVAALVHPDEAHPAEDVVLDERRVRACWDALKTQLREHGTVDEVPGALVVQGERGAVTVHLQPRPWAELVGGQLPDDHDEGLGWYGVVDANLLMRGDDETHLVLFRGRLHRSTRAETPLVAGRPSSGGWSATRPG